MALMVISAVSAEDIGKREGAISLVERILVAQEKSSGLYDNIQEFLEHFKLLGKIPEKVLSISEAYTKVEQERYRLICVELTINQPEDGFKFAKALKIDKDGFAS